MAMMGALTAVVAMYGVLMALAPALQVRRMRSEASARGVSLGYAWVLWVGFCIWLVYGLARDDVPLILTNAVNVVVTGLMILVATRTRRSEERGLAPAPAPGP
jgi:MtN3 and saliva related transmembrane protein